MSNSAAGVDSTVAAGGRRAWGHSSLKISAPTARRPGHHRNDDEGPLPYPGRRARRARPGVAPPRPGVRPTPAGSRLGDKLPRDHARWESPAPLNAENLVSWSRVPRACAFRARESGPGEGAGRGPGSNRSGRRVDRDRADSGRGYPRRWASSGPINLDPKTSCPAINLTTWSLDCRWPRDPDGQFWLANWIPSCRFDLKSWCWARIDNLISNLI